MSPVNEKHAKSLTLRQIAFLGVGLGVLLPAIVFGAWTLKDRHDEERRFYLNTLTNQYADVLSQAASTPLWNVDEEAVGNLADALMRNPDVTLVRVDELSQGLFAERIAPKAEDAAMYKASRLIVYNGDPIGTATVGMNVRAVEARLNRDLLSAVATLALQVLLSLALVLFVLDRRVIRPIKHIKQEAVRLSRGELDAPLQWERNDEIGLLAGGLDSMRQDLRELIGEIDQKNAALSQELHERIATENALRHTEEKFKIFFNASPVALAVGLRENNHTYAEVNDQWVRQFGYSREEACQKNGLQLGIWADAEDRHRIIQQLERSGTVSGYEAWMYARDSDEPFLCRFTGRSIQYGDQTLELISMQDVTAVHRHEQEMMQLNALLEERVQERTEALTRTNEDLRTAVRNLEHAQAELLQREKMAALGALVAGIAHELNTPIGNSVTAASTLQDQTRDFERALSGGITKSALERFVEGTGTASDIVLRNLRRASELVTSFKRVAVDQTSDQRRNFHLDELVKETLMTLGPSIRKSGHEVRHELTGDPMMDSYPGALSQILTNLINNALLHAFEDKPHGVVTIHAEPLGQEEVELSVEDDGCGISQENIGRIFNPFFTTRMGEGGSGLGLHIAYNLVTGVLGGKIRAESTPGQGTRLVITLPRHAPERKERPPT
ncbi:MAG: hypothetical protein CMK33_04090 [Porticoccaceae bacterium]|nr:hypothetical protein [Porticoccaceae bacterium]